MKQIKLSPSTINLMLECPRCFWLQIVKGIKRPSGPFPSLPSGMDKILKEHFDITFSHGVLEHFSDEDIVSIVNNEVKISKYVIVSIPSDFYKDEDKMYGDERFMSVRKWEEILNQTDGRIIKKSGYYFQNAFFELMNFVMPNFMINHAPYIYFVLESKDNH